MTDNGTTITSSGLTRRMLGEEGEPLTVSARRLSTMFSGGPCMIGCIFFGEDGADGHDGAGVDAGDFNEVKENLLNVTKSLNDMIGKNQALQERQTNIIANVTAMQGDILDIQTNALEREQDRQDFMRVQNDAWIAQNGQNARVNDFVALATTANENALAHSQANAETAIRIRNAGKQTAAVVSANSDRIADNERRMLEVQAAGTALTKYTTKTIAGITARVTATATRVTAIMQAAGEATRASVKQVDDRVSGMATTFRTQLVDVADQATAMNAATRADFANRLGHAMDLTYTLQTELEQGLADLQNVTLFNRQRDLASVDTRFDGVYHDMAALFNETEERSLARTNESNAQVAAELRKVYGEMSKIYLDIKDLRGYQASEVTRISAILENGFEEIRETERATQRLVRDVYSLLMDVDSNRDPRRLMTKKHWEQAATVDTEWWTPWQSFPGLAPDPGYTRAAVLDTLTLLFTAAPPATQVRNAIYLYPFPASRA